VPIVSFLHAPYLAELAPIPLEERPIDLLFFGCLNPRRHALLDRIEAAGVSVSRFDGPMYGPERDSYIRQAKAVFNGHFYESARFEQTRASQCMSLGTPLISERGDATAPPEAYEDSVFWLRDEALTDFFKNQFNTPAFFDDARRKLEAFAKFDPIEQYADVLAFAAGYRQAHARRIAAGPWQPAQLHIGSGKDYKPGWLNVDILESALPDVVLDLSRPQQWPMALSGATCGPVLLEPGSLDVIYANNVLEHVGDLPQLMTNCLALLKDGGRMLIEVPHERAPTAWQDPTHVRALNDRSWIYYTDWFWYLGWFESRFKQEKFEYLDARLQVCAREQGQFMRVVLTKTPTSMAERMTARTMRADFGGIEDDILFSAEEAPIEPVHEAFSQENSARPLVKAA
jgi:SAM-dependent methyltransferase